MSVFNGLEINASGLALERLKLDTISTNIANVNTTHTTEGGAYKSKTVQFGESLKNAQAAGESDTGIGSQMSYGVKVTGISQDNTDKVEYDPTNADADQNGYVHMSNVNLSDQMVNMIQTMRTYEANTSAAESNKDILKKALEISKS
ncbi:flagellar basal body rod protein FlgC [Liquorilactobacillus mali]|uniref:Flagellar basal-body rod protein FlgC n=1 Tax=Liquorilactobacillus mali KCTC 3596 = DSM 20444 TaxID=1046596 RepID=J1F613_9LACO|nr:flagellar basal body rod protein FlgC [Liquorilactobacillus mali]AJA34116.1 flagellar basal-body rod protein FlgC [Liquorilactobacillus mali KCTC 3596 = DSM 20444]EJF02193.1 flagellar basal-body rod protein FlgC [Liquorilactobacillus mali KCTC 3596 = DSM 20444]KRN11139.1 flagellar basal-body rod protein FlgC [Liquorilactobacillus mali KCTC 3596 = DSM 20444]MDC7953978.1 flagellar basal body rod protein FlgC [Liquorilactobacillus mali]MDV7757453.1 flagellar basal body rod protein FlgC [Liquor